MSAKIRTSPTSRMSLPRKQLLAHEPDSVAARRGQSFQKQRNERQEIGEAICLRAQNNCCYWQRNDGLLKGEISVHRHKRIETCRSQAQQLTIAYRGPPHLAGSSYVMPRNGARETPIDALIKEDSHRTDSTSLSLACSRKATTCSRETEGNPA